MKVSDLKAGDEFISEKLNVDNKQTICTLISYQGMNGYVIDAGGCMLLADGNDEVELIKTNYETLSI
tara:strand:- start:2652 stop:2852 length:201 start_codon:yes stop_codon:yes gene_type:complete